MIKYTKKRCQYFLASLHPYETMRACSRIWIKSVSVHMSILLRSFAKTFCVTVFFPINPDHTLNLLRRMANSGILDAKIGVIHFNIISSIMKSGHRTFRIIQPMHLSPGPFGSGLKAYNNNVQKIAREILKSFAQSVKK